MKRLFYFGFQQNRLRVHAVRAVVRVRRNDEAAAADRQTIARPRVERATQRLRALIVRACEILALFDPNLSATLWRFQLKPSSKFFAHALREVGSSTICCPCSRQPKAVGEAGSAIWQPAPLAPEQRGLFPAPLFPLLPETSL